LKTVKIFDTTLRDGEQCLDSSLSITDKLKIAQQLEKLNVDIIEAGFPVASTNEFKAISKIAEVVRKPIICALGRSVKNDIDKSWEAIQFADKPRLHTFVATSDLHMKYKLKKTPNDIIKLTNFGVEHAKGYCEDVEFTPEDASRSNLDFLCEVIETAIESGATTINIPDTVGYSQPTEFGTLISSIIKCVPKIKHVNISVHCHNDLGVGVANALAGIKNGANQVECTINGVGERAGNTSLDEIVMAIKTRSDYYQAKTNIVTEELFNTSQIVSEITRIPVQKNKAIVGENAFVHKAGIHQHGMLQNKATYEIITPESVGWRGKEIQISKHSGKHAFLDLLTKNSLKVSESTLSKIISLVMDYTDIHNSISNEKFLEIAKSQIINETSHEIDKTNEFTN
jgi:2-isopropylmalate synthase